MTTAATQVELSPVAGTAGPKPRHWIRTVLSSPRGLGSASYLVLVTVAGFLAAQLAPYDPEAQDLSVVLTGPSSDHLLGADALGRDVLSRLLYGILPSLENSLIALAVFIAIGVPTGILAGYVGGLVDAFVNRLCELVLSIPPIIMVLVVLAVFSSSATAAMVTLGAVAAPGLVRVARGATLLVREELFVKAAQISGAAPVRIMRTHVVRQVLGPVLAQATVFAGIGLAVQAALSFLGLLSSSDRPTWGGMIGDASQVIIESTWLLFPPGITLAVTVLALGVLGDAIRDATSAGSTPSSTSTPKRRRRVNASASPVVPDPDALLVVRGLEISTGRTVLVDDATFSIKAGETVAVVGESGCGKTLTALAVLGLAPEGVQVTGGQVVFDGVDLTVGGAAAYQRVRGSGIAYVAQDALGSLDPTHSVGSHLVEVIRVHDKVSKSAARSRADELLRQVRIAEPDRVFRAYPHEVSGGMAQRVNIAIALAGRPKLLVADEPTTALDVTVQAEVLRLLRELRDDTGMAILLITHDWGVVADLADIAVVMYAGEVVETAPTADIFRAPRFPYTAALLSADPSRTTGDTRLPTVPGRVPAPGSWPRGCRFAGRCEFTTEACTEQNIPLLPLASSAVTRCIRVEELVEMDALPR